MFQVPDIELPDTAICAHRGKDVLVFGEVNVVDLFVVCNQLGVHCPFLDVPDGARGVYGAGPDQVDFLRVPIEGSQGGAELVFALEVQTQNGLLVVEYFVNFEVFPRSGNQVGRGSAQIGIEQYFGRRVAVLKSGLLLEFSLLV